LEGVNRTKAFETDRKKPKEIALSMTVLGNAEQRGSPGLRRTP
jgi:hypothetical protein